MRIEKLNYYPLKSGAGVGVTQGVAYSHGLEGDREFMIVDSNHQFVTQRKSPRMMHISLDTHDNHITIQTPSGQVCATRTWNDICLVKVWRDELKAYTQDAEINNFLSKYLQMPVRLVAFGPDSRRLANHRYTDRQVYHRFADGYPYLITSRESLDDLNHRITSTGAVPVPMERFRSNIVISGWDIPYREDEIQHLRIGSVIFAFAKPCARCAITTLDQSTEQKGAEPLKTLATYRYSEKVAGLTFGVNMYIVEGAGQIIKLEDKVEIIA